MAGEDRCPDCGELLQGGASTSSCGRCLHEDKDGTDPSAAATVKKQLPETEDDQLNQIDSSIGHYRLLRKIGEGGMGYVYAAEQRSPVRRKVAIKVIKPGMDSREVLARFDAEKQALALMDHPNIARVLDGGAMKNGRPYFVMDLVTGLPLTEYCDQHKLALEDRLELFVQVCQGVQHAHQKAIIHRDLKPSNVVVTVNSGQPIPKVIDFGIAKAMGSELTMQTYYTLAGQVIGTPQYMSPEQAGSGPSDIDTRSDIYSLGVLLDELLTGQTPIAREDLERIGLEEMLRLIREQEGVRPSTQLTQLTRLDR
ncbi:MAG: serine/threonine protein kinase, partial [Verrucomicrobiales bacterium]